jgi:hypothetical protein
MRYFEVLDNIIYGIREEKVDELTDSSAIAYLPSGFRSVQKALKTLSKMKKDWNVQVIEQEGRRIVDLEGQLEIVVDNNDWDDFVERKLLTDTKLESGIIISLLDEGAEDYSETPEKIQHDKWQAKYQEMSSRRQGMLDVNYGITSASEYADWKMKVGKFAKAKADVGEAVPDTKAEIQKTLDKYETEDATVEDIVDEVESIVTDHLKDEPSDDKAYKLQKAIDKFRKEQEYDYKLKGRGDMDTANDKVMAAIEKYVADKAKAEVGGKEIGEPYKYGSFERVPILGDNGKTVGDISYEVDGDVLLIDMIKLNDTTIKGKGVAARALNSLMNRLGVTKVKPIDADDVSDEGAEFFDSFKFQPNKAKAEIEEKVYYHNTNTELPNSFVVDGKISSRTAETLVRDYGIEDFDGGLFVSDSPNMVYGKNTYKIVSDKEPMMLDNGKYIFPKGSVIKSVKESLRSVKGVEQTGISIVNGCNSLPVKNLINESIDVGLEGTVDGYRGVDKATAKKWAKGVPIPTRPLEQMPLDWEVVEYSLGDTIKDMSDEEIEEYVQGVVPWYDGSAKSVEGGLNVTTDFENAKGYAGDNGFVLCLEFLGEYVEFSDAHTYVKNAKEVKVVSIYSVKNDVYYTPEDFIKKVGSGVGSKSNESISEMATDDLSRVFFRLEKALYGVLASPSVARLENQFSLWEKYLKVKSYGSNMGVAIPYSNNTTTMKKAINKIVNEIKIAYKDDLSAIKSATASLESGRPPSAIKVLSDYPYFFGGILKSIVNGVELIFEGYVDKNLIITETIKISDKEVLDAVEDDEQVRSVGNVLFPKDKYFSRTIFRSLRDAL